MSHVNEIDVFPGKFDGSYCYFVAAGVFSTGGFSVVLANDFMVVKDLRIVYRTTTSFEKLIGLADKLRTTDGANRISGLVLRGEFSKILDS